MANGAVWWKTWTPVIAACVVILASIAALVSKINSIEGQHSADCQIFAKIETQMGSVENALNEAHVRDKADIGALKEKVFGEPAAPYYYEIKIPHEVMPC